MKVIQFFLALAITSTCCHAFSQQTTIPSPFAAPFAQFQRMSLKKKLTQAAKAKDEPLILSLVHELSQLNPTKVPTNGLLGYNGASGSSAPMNGAWRLLYTNAKDAEAPARTEKNSDDKFGDEVATNVDVKTGQRIDAASGECVNFIKLSGDSPKRPFDLLEITIKMTPLSDSRVRLDFMKGRALNERAPLPFLKDFSFNFPPPAFGDFIAKLRGMDPSVEPQAYFDILYIDQQMRAHRTGEGKIFVQMRD
jgi:hypothetical protein